DSLQRKVDAERARLYDGSVANPKELQSIEHEVQGILSRKSRIEDQLLERMEEREELEGRVPGAEAEATAARERIALLESTTARELVHVSRQLEDRVREREAAAAEIDPELLVLYGDLRRQKQGGGAAALGGRRRAGALGATAVLLRSDSKLLIEQLAGRFKVRNARLIELHAEVRDLTSGFRSIRYEHVPRERNREADRLANQGVDEWLRSGAQTPSGSRP